MVHIMIGQPPTQAKYALQGVIDDSWRLRSRLLQLSAISYQVGLVEDQAERGNVRGCDR